MSGKAGVWVDHRQSIIVALGADGPQTSHIVSHVEKHPERTGDSPLKGPYEARQVPRDDSRQRALTGHLNTYYDTVVAALRNYDALLLLGPGEAKGELQKRLIKAKLGARIEAVETADKMTDPQIVAKVRAHFGASAPRVPQDGPRVPQDGEDATRSGDEP
ncbi:MAG TPA: hypothetical protein VME42_05825 [Steroidobacteraceae bacterium]|nr:hypothetical protein [Steroidobacteraceae bacterium]